MRHVNNEHQSEVNDVVLVFLLLTLNIFHHSFFDANNTFNVRGRTKILLDTTNYKLKTKLIGCYFLITYLHQTSNFSGISVANFRECSFSLTSLERATSTLDERYLLRYAKNFQKVMDKITQLFNRVK